MPYIKQKQRKILKKDPLPFDAGELNYLFTLVYIKGMSTIKDKDTRTLEIKRRHFAQKEMKKIVKTYLIINSNTYQTYNDVAGAVTLSVSEFLRRTGDTTAWHDYLNAGLDVLDSLQTTIDPYEDKKIKENGDVYPCRLLRTSAKLAAKKRA